MYGVECTGDITIPVMSVDPADGELLTRAILQAEQSNDLGTSGYGPQSFVQGMFGVGDDTTDNDRAGIVATVDMLEIPPKLR